VATEVALCIVHADEVMQRAGEVHHTARVDIHFRSRGELPTLALPNDTTTREIP
jgi:hypothetical protein